MAVTAGKQMGFQPHRPQGLYEQRRQYGDDQQKGKHGKLGAGFPGRYVRWIDDVTVGVMIGAVGIGDGMDIRNMPMHGCIPGRRGCVMVQVIMQREQRQQQQCHDQCPADRITMGGVSVESQVHYGRRTISKTEIRPAAK